MDYMQEKNEAIQAGQRAISSLQEAKRQISGAKGFGIWDLFGGGTFVSIAKHFKINNAKRAIENARFELQTFSTELRDISINLNIEIGDFLTVFDLMDNFFADIMVQSRLEDASRKIDDTIRRVEDVLRQLQ